MAGYNYERMKSNNAIIAEASGIFPGSHIVKKLKIKGLTVAKLKKLVNPCEYHHTGTKYQKTDYYDLSECFEFFNNPENKIEIDNILNNKKDRILENCVVNISEFYKRSGRWYCIDTVHENCTVKIIGQFAHITDKYGKDLGRKKLSGKNIIISHNHTIIKE